MANIVQKKQGEKIYYYYHEKYRQKINKDDSGKVRGSGKSKVCTRAVYLGSAENILSCVQEKRKPISVKTRSFGLIAAAYQVSQKIGLIQILTNNIKGFRYKIPRWIYFFVTIINRLDNATSQLPL